MPCSLKTGAVKRISLALTFQVIDIMFMSDLQEESSLCSGSRAAVTTLASALLRASDGNILGETVVGQTAVHAQWGGVVPTLAMEAHKRAIDKAVEEVLQQAGLPLNTIAACAATIGPGLSMCLQVSLLNTCHEVCSA